MLTKLRICWVALGTILLSLGQQAALAQASKHPLNSLSAAEMKAVVAILKTKQLINQDSRFATMNLHEPPKPAVWNWKPGVPLPNRAAFVVVKQGPQVFEGIVDVTARKVAFWQPVKGVQPGILNEEYELARAWLALTQSGRRQCASGASKT